MQHNICKTTFTDVRHLQISQYNLQAEIVRTQIYPYSDNTVQ